MGPSRNPRTLQSTPHAVWLAVLFICSAAVAAEGACNCDAIKMTPAPVCGSDGVTYANACVATCQGVKLAAPSACGSGSGGPSTAAFASEISQQVAASAAVSRAVLNMHRAQGFLYVARIRLDAQTKVQTPTVVRTDEEGKSSDTMRRPQTVMRISYAGSGVADLYALPASAGNASDSAGKPGAASIDPQPAGGLPARGRKLAQGNIVGEDNRIDADMLPHVMPLSAVGYLSNGCTAALITPRTVLTARHCIYNGNSGKWQLPAGFLPNLHGGGAAHCHAGNHPRRCYKPRQVSFVSAVIPKFPSKCGPPTSSCITEKDIADDIAVLILAESVREYGAFGLAYDCSANAQTTFSVYTAGYPADKPSPYLYYNHHVTNQPTITLKMCPTGAKSGVTSQLDSYAGQSGSPVWSSDGNVRAVHSAVGGGKSFHAPIDKEAFQFVAKYAV